MTNADRIRALAAAEPDLPQAELGRRLGVTRQAVHLALSSAPRHARQATRQRLSVTIDAELVAELRAEAEASGEPLSHVVERRLRGQRR